MAKKEWLTQGIDGLTFGERLGDLISSRGINQSQLAEQTGIKQSAISEYINGRKNGSEPRSPDCATIIELSRFFGVSTDFLLGLSAIKSHIADIKAVCEFTGLSESAVNGLKTPSSRSVAFISKLIAQGEITHIGLLYDGLIHSVSNLNTATNLYENIDPASSHPADVKVVKDYYRAKDNADIAQWKLERSIRKLLEKMLKGEQDHGID